MLLALVRSLAIPAVTLGLAVATAQAAPADCEAHRERFERARSSLDLEAMKASADAITRASGCENAYRDWARSTVARELTRKAREAVSGGAPLPSQRDVLEDALSYGPVWQAAAWLGDIGFDAGRFAEAARRYQEALTHISDVQATPQAPPEPAIAHIFRQAELARLAADEYVPSPTTRAGAPSGLGSPSVRGFVPKKVAVPIEFQFGSTTLTPRGLQAAEELFTSLAAAGTPAVTLIGHTDPVGAAEYNQSLSVRRAGAVRDFLVTRGFTGQISVEGRGSGEPLAIPDPARFNRAQLHQMLRRVEVVK